MLMYGPGPSQRSRITKADDQPSYMRDAAKIIATRMMRPVQRAFR